MHPYLQANDPLVEPPVRLAFPHIRLDIQHILNPPIDDKQPPFSSPPIQSNVEPYFQHDRGSSPPHLPSIQPIRCNYSNLNTRLVGSASNSCTGIGKAVVSKSPMQEQQYRYYHSGNPIAENLHTSGPDTPHSSSSSFKSSSALPEQLPLLESSASQPPLMNMNPLGRTPSSIGGSRYEDYPFSDVAHASQPILSQEGSHIQYGGGPMIPVTIDLKSGSSHQSKKRKANSAATKRFRIRKVQRQQEIEHLKEQVQKLTWENDFYRDRLREHNDFVPVPSFPSSPASRERHSIVVFDGQPLPMDLHQQAMGMEGEMMSKTVDTGTPSSLDSNRVGLNLEYLENLDRQLIRMQKDAGLVDDI